MGRPQVNGKITSGRSLFLLNIRGWRRLEEERGMWTRIVE
jgi:hypothetical protein